MIQQYRVSVTLTVDEIMSYCFHHPLVTAIQLTSWTQLSNARVSAAKPLDIFLRCNVSSRAEIEANDLPVTVTSLNVSSQRIGNAGATMVAGILQRNTSIRQLDLSNSAITVDGAKRIAASLHSNTSLLNLDVADNRIGAKALAAALQHNTTLRSLNLTAAAIGNSGATALATALQTNTSLQKLDLCYNSITADGVKALAAALQCNSALLLLGLAKNLISTAGVSAIATVLHGQYNVKHTRSTVYWSYGYWRQSPRHGITTQFVITTHLLEI